MSAHALDVHFDNDTFTVRLSDGRALTVPLVWFPALHDATVEQRQCVRISASGQGLHWPDLDEDISITGLLAGHGDMTSRRSRM